MMVKVSPVASLSLPAWIHTGLFAFFFMRFFIDGLQFSLCHFYLCNRKSISGQIFIFGSQSANQLTIYRPGGQMAR